MKKALQISLAGTLFAIEEDAYERLDSYIKSVRKHFASTDGRDEIVRDIETRIAEQLLETGKAVISTTEVDAVIASMGRVEDFGDDSSPEAPHKQERRKLYRDTDKGILGGVAAGLGAFLGLDPLWLRLAFVLFALADGAGVLVYILLWVLVPEAKTAAQKLEMEGAPVNLETLSENVREKVDDVRKKHGGRIGNGIRRFLKGISRVLNSIAGAIMPVARFIIGIALAIGSFAGILAASFCAPLVLTNVSNPYLFDFPLVELVSAGAVYTFVIGAYLVIILPLVVVFMLAVALMRKKAVGALGTYLVLLVLWCAALVSSGVSAANAVPRIESYVSERQSEVRETKQIEIAGNVSEIDVRHGIDVRIVQGDEPRLTATGNASALESLRVSENGNGLIIEKTAVNRTCIFCVFSGSLHVELTLPDAQSVRIQHGSSVETDGWHSDKAIVIEALYGSSADIRAQAPEISVTAEHGSDVSVDGTFSTTTVFARYGSTVELAGSSSRASLSAEHGAYIDAERMSAEILDASPRSGGIIEPWKQSER